VEEQGARSMLGTIDRDHVTKLARALAAGDAPTLVEAARALEEFSPDYGQVLDDLASLLTRVALRQLVPDYDGDELFDTALLTELAAAIPGEDIQLYYQTAILGRRDLGFAPDPRTGFEMTLVRMLAFRPAAAGQSAGSGAGSGSQARGAASGAGPRASASSEPAPIVRPAAAGPIDPVQWARVVGDLDVSGATRQLAANSALIEHKGNGLQLGLDARSAALNTPANRERLIQALGKYLGGPVKLDFVDGAPAIETPTQNVERRSAETLEAARRSLAEDPAVREMQTRFGATLHPESVRPTE
jgi:DNA polymerase III subunit gamma/tau